MGDERRRWGEDVALRGVGFLQGSLVKLFLRYFLFLVGALLLGSACAERIWIAGWGVILRKHPVCLSVWGGCS